MRGRYRLQPLTAAMLLAATACATGPAAQGSLAGNQTTGHLSPSAPTFAAVEEPVAVRAAARTVRVAVAGDVLLHNGLWHVAANDARKAGLPAGSLDFAPMFRPVRPLIAAADLAICHLETPLAHPKGPFRSYPLFSVPPQVVEGLRKTGFDACTTASNHSLDQGFAGLRRTLRVLDRQGLEHAGTARSEAERRTLTVMNVKGVGVALLSYTYGTNGIPLARARPGAVKMTNPARIRADARRAKAAGADAVLVALHWGTEYRHRPSAYQWKVVRAVTRSPHVDLVHGHHAHVVQPIRRVNGTWVVFGLGNFVAQQDPRIVGVYEAMVARFDLVLHRPGSVAVKYAGYRPTYISRYRSSNPAMRVLDIDRELASRRHPPAVRHAMASARQRVVTVVGPRKR